ncbi:NAD(P)-dependent dehydrogenase, short-chain alcohol dehydrogenase family [Noviherbaspirillum humi]|uniref:NAD(P)-dependent dehydrogenase, short-chain alcohol dehydrogenase family n=1 Tax=Noviherbaspirillum humi TaxID=1688639 RepID=A0A239K116_9BURK|nr:SDR family oxidoreductase [Noviherbaspirillum humi]SNT11373.1 NAD(P)-dependent dehydrogenase, short-chain alcohol dehydrogenase family [Noviherbaspirillum humi]
MENQTDIERAPRNRLDGVVAVIAGGMGAIGQASARRFAELGASVVVLHRGSEDEARAFLATLPGKHGQVVASITDSAQLKRAAEQVKEQFGRADILVNTAGFTKPVPAADLEALTDELIDDIFAANWRGVFATIRAFVPLLKAAPDGLVVNVSSIAGFTGVGSNLAYAAAKAGIDVLGKSLARSLAPQVRVLTVSPGVVDSTFVPGRGPDFNAKTAATMPLKRVGTVEDVAAAIEACATTLRFSTGNTIVVDGGRSL